MGHWSRGKFLVGLAALSLIVVAGQARVEGQETKSRADAPSRKGKDRERVAGVVTKVEKIEKKGSSPPSNDNPDKSEGPRTLRLTINTAAVWRDWSRDQATKANSASPKKESAEGDNSVATKGQPADTDTLVVVDLTADTNVETRFRTPEDEASKGSKSPDAARTDSSKSKDSGKPTRFKADDLKAGLFVEVDFRHTTGQNRATTVSVVRPVAETGTTRSK